MALISSSSPLEASPKIAVVGAGLAGLTTAYRLHEKGFDVALYEANNRVGGRVFTVTISGRLGELGGQNILDGGDATNLFKLIEDLDLTTESFQTKMNTQFVTDGKIFKVREALKEKKFNPQRLKSRLYDLAKQAKSMQDILIALFDEQEILYKFCTMLLTGYEGAPPEKLSPYYVETLYHILTGGVSSAHKGAEEEVYINHCSVSGGNSLIAKAIAQKLSDRLFLNQVLIAVERKNDRYTLKFQNGHEAQADIVVLAVPCTIIKDLAIDKTLIDEDRHRKIGSIEYGSSAKILEAVDAIPEEGFYSNARFSTFLNRNYAILNMYYLRENGDFTPETIESLTVEDIEFVRNHYHLTLPLPPVMAENMAFSAYDRPVCHSWFNDPYIKGSYSYIGVGQEKLLTEMTEVFGEKVKTLFAPINNTLFFAGEHTSTMIEVGGTMEAAVESGEKTARLIEQAHLLVK